jgi:hypothetical protein
VNARGESRSPVCSPASKWAVIGQGIGWFPPPSSSGCEPDFLRGRRASRIAGSAPVVPADTSRS